MSGSQIQVDTAQFVPASEWMRELGDGVGALESVLVDQSWYPVEAWRTAAALKLLQASGEAALLQFGLGGLAGMACGLADHLLQAQQWYEDVDAQIVATFAELSDTATTAIVIGIVNLGLVGAGALAATLMSPGGVALVLAEAVLHHGLEESELTAGGEALGSWLGNNQHTLANPVVVMLVRALVSGGDEIIAEVAAGPTSAAAAMMFGPLGAIAAQTLIRQSIRSPESAAGTLANVIQRANGEHRYEMNHAEREPSATPESVGDLMQSIPTTEAEGTHVTVSEYLTPNGEHVYVVSVAGTSSTGFGGANPMDNLSNLAAYAGHDDETIGATITAMEHAGITPGDAVVFAGYSQGALVAAALAASGDWDTQSVLLAGSPIHGNEIGGTIPVVQLEHSGDLITGLQGFVPPAAGEVAVVHRDPYPHGVPQDQGILGPHMLKTYQETALLYDRHDTPAATANRDALLSPIAGATPVASHDFHLEREYVEPELPDSPRAEENRPSVPSQILPDLGDLAGRPFSPVGILGVEEALKTSPEVPAMPDAYRVEVPRPRP